MRSPSPGPSLFLVGHEESHRDASWGKGKGHEHQHQKFHNHNKRHAGGATAAATPPESSSVLTEVSVTVSVVQQIDVDPNGNTLAVLMLTADAAATGSLDVLTDIPLLPGASSMGSYTDSECLSSSQTATSALTSTPSLAGFASLIVNSNSTTALISSSSSLSHTLTNSSSLSSSRSSLTYLTSSSSSSTSSSTSSSSTNTFSSTSTSYQPAASNGVLVGGTAIAPGSATSTAASSGNASNSNSGPAVSTSAVVGGVVGSIAGVTVLAFLLLFIIKWRRTRNGTLLSLGSGRDGEGDTKGTATGGQPSQPSGGMAERRSFAYMVPAALASLTGYKHAPRQTDGTGSSPAGSERGFYRVSGRKLPSVLHNGGDGYGGNITDDHTVDGSSFYRDSHSFYGGAWAPTSPSLQKPRDSGQIGTPVMRPSPARTPVTEQNPFSDVPPIDPLSPPRPDVLGRSHPSQDGSHTSRFTEQV